MRGPSSDILYPTLPPRPGTFGAASGSSRGAPGSPPRKVISEFKPFVGGAGMSVADAPMGFGGGAGEDKNAPKEEVKEEQDEVDRLAQSVELRFAGISLEQVRRRLSLSLSLSLALARLDLTDSWAHLCRARRRSASRSRAHGARHRRALEQLARSTRSRPLASRSLALSPSRSRHDPLARLAYLSRVHVTLACIPCLSLRSRASSLAFFLLVLADLLALPPFLLLDP